MKKLLFLFTLSLCSIGVWAQLPYDFYKTSSGQTLFYKVTDEITHTVEVVPPSNSINSWSGYSKPTGPLTIPSTVSYNGNDYSVTSIGDRAFYQCAALTSVTIPNSVTSFGEFAFGDCNSLANVNFIGTIAEWCGIAFDGLVANPIYYAHTISFNGTPVGTTLTIPESVTSIENCAFVYCRGITSVTIPNSVTTIGICAFYNCYDLANVNYTGTIAEWCGITFNLSDANPTSYAHTISFNGTPMGTTLTIPNSVTSIGEYAFYGCNRLTSVTISNSVTSIGKWAFAGCSGLNSVTIPNSVTSIGGAAFYECSGLTSVTIPNSVTSIGSSVFYNCSKLKTVYNLSSLEFAPNFYSLSANRVVVPTTSGSGTNTIYQIPDEYSFVNDEDNEEYHIPRATIPNIDNLIYNDGGWKAKNIVLSDGQDTFEAPETFTAEKATYIRNYTQDNRSTLCLPFKPSSVSPADKLKFYEFSNFDGATISFSEVAFTNLQANKPYMVEWPVTKTKADFVFSASNVTFPATGDAASRTVTKGNGKFVGTMARTCMTSSNYGYSNGFFVQSADGTPDVHTSHAHVNPFRAYFEITSVNPQQSLPPTLSVEFGEGDNLSIEEPLSPSQQNNSIRYSKNVYDLMGRLVRRNADSLDGLPRGIYIWKGKKVIYAR